MEEFFASIFEWFGMNPFYSTDLGDHLRGFDITCTDYIGTPFYNILGWSMIGLTFLSYMFKYHFIDSSNFNTKFHWWITAFVNSLIIFLVSFFVVYNSKQAGEYCADLNFSSSDIFGFGISISIWGFVLFALLTSSPIPRKFSVNCRNTTLWKP